MKKSLAVIIFTITILFSNNSLVMANVIAEQGVENLIARNCEEEKNVWDENEKSAWSGAVDSRLKSVDERFASSDRKLKAIDKKYSDWQQAEKDEREALKKAEESREEQAEREAELERRLREIDNRYAN